ncbi:MAG TPA: glycosyltransferase family 2 protein [Chloroflexota bacterium]|nr:glycosyltransferase family 2 protein [Chloroflexota bacterium]
MTANKVVVLIPALNEEGSIGKVIDDIPRAELMARGYEVSVVVVDGRSIDRTLEIAREKGAYIMVQKGKGKGVGVRQAIALCNPPEGTAIKADHTGEECSDFSHLVAMLEAEYLVMMDADGTYPCCFIPDMISALEGGADVVMGSRLRGRIEECAMTRTHHFGNIILSDLASLLYQQPCTDLCTGMWGFNSQALRRLELNSKHFELEAELFAESIKKGLRVEEIPVDYLPRVGETKLVPLSAGWAIMTKLLERRFWSAAGEFDWKLTKRPEKSPAPMPFRTH